MWRTTCSVQRVWKLSVRDCIRPFRFHSCFKIGFSVSPSADDLIFGGLVYYWLLFLYVRPASLLKIRAVAVCHKYVDNLRLQRWVWDMSKKFAIMRVDLTGTAPDMIHEKGKVIPGQALMAPGSWGSQTSRHSPHECGESVSPTHRPLLSPTK